MIISLAAGRAAALCAALISPPLLRPSSTLIRCSALQPPDVARLAEAARISLSPAEVEEFAPKIRQVVDCYELAQWWESFGGNVPNLRIMAVKILNLTRSSSRCEWNWSTFEISSDVSAPLTYPTLYEDGGKHCCLGGSNGSSQCIFFPRTQVGINLDVAKQAVVITGTEIVGCYPNSRSHKLTLSRFGQLQAVNLEGIDPSFRADTEAGAIPREDVPEIFDEREAILAAVPCFDDPYIKVPKVINKE